VSALPEPAPALLETRHVSKHYAAGKGVLQALGRGTPEVLRAVDDVSVRIERGETLGLVGESGSGKSTLGRLVLQLEPPTSGDILYDGQSVLGRRARETRELRKRIQVVFQDPYSSLNPTMTVRQMLEEVLKVHKLAPRAGRRDRVEELLETVGLAPGSADRKPHQFSGGQRQRIGIARALAVEPEFIIADEAVSALDVSVQAQVLNLMVRLQDQLGLTYLFIAHNLAVMRHISRNVAVMYLGRIVEHSPTADLFREPLHPYTQALMKAAPAPVARRKSIQPALTGDMPNPISPPAGCHFHPRCPHAMDVCRVTYPATRVVGGHRSVACHLYPDPEPPKTTST
jgi:oligopeptide/dipeptide ABC transporter ATP-binding protein